MPKLTRIRRIGMNTRTIAVLSLTIGLTGVLAHPDSEQAAQEDMADMPGHIYMTALAPPKAGDQQKADAIVAAAKSAMAPYEDYHKALADGYKIFLPDVPQPQYHFTNRQSGLEARSHLAVEVQLRLSQAKLTGLGRSGCYLCNSQS